MRVEGGCQECAVLPSQEELRDRESKGMGCQECAVLPGQEELGDREWPGVPEEEEAR